MAEVTSPQSKTARWKKVHDRAMQRWKLVSDAEAEQRKQELEDLRFARGRKTDQWETLVVQEREGTTASPEGDTSTQRPTLVIDKLDQPLNSIINEMRRSKLALQIKPKGDGANKATADVLQGLIRTIETDSYAQAARVWAYGRAVKCGRGYYRIDVDYANDGDLDLDIRYRMIMNQGSVYCDPFATLPDRSDMGWAFITGDYAKDGEYLEKFGGLDGAESIIELTDESELQTVNDQSPGWLQKDSVRVAEYYEVEVAKATLVVRGTEKFIVDGDRVIADGYRLPAGCAPLPKAQFGPGDIKNSRNVPLRRVCVYVLNGQKVLSETPWNGRYIPIIPVFGKVDNVDGEVSYQGVVTKSKDPQRLYNAVASGAVEALQSQTKSPWIAAAGQIDRHKAMWDESNVKNYAVLLYDPMEHNGSLLPPPQRTNQEPALMGHAMLIQQADLDLKATTGRYQASLGQLNPSDRSGKAIEKLQQQAELGSSNFLDDFAWISMHYEGVVMLDLIPTVYDRPGRVVRLLGDAEDDERAVMLNQPFVDGGPQGPQAVNQPGLIGQALEKVRTTFGGKPKDIQKYDLSRGNYQVVPSVGPSDQTIRDQNLAILETIIEHAPPELTANILDLYAENLQGPMGTKVAERLRAMNPNLPKGEMADLPPEAQAIISGLQAQAQEMGAALQEAQMAVATNQAKQQASLQIAQMEAQGRILEIRLKGQAEMAKIGAQLQSQEERDRFQAAMEKALQDDQQAFDLLLEQLKLGAAVQAEARAEAAASRADDRKEGAAVRASFRADQSAADADTRKAQHAADADARKDAAGHRAAFRDEGIAMRADQRSAQTDDRAAYRDEGIAARADDRAEQTATRATKLQAKLAPKPEAKTPTK